MTVGIGPHARVDGPRPLARKYGLLQATNVPGSGVTLVPEADGRWESGVNVWPYPTGAATVFDALVTGTSQPDKGFGPDDIDMPNFLPIGLAYIDTCTAATLARDEQAFRTRASTVFAVVEGAALEHELLHGDLVPSNLHLSDGTGDFPNTDAPTTALNGLALLEDAIASATASGALGMSGLIHLSPGLAAILRANYVISDEGDGVLRTGNGTVVIPGAGYVGGDDPSGGGFGGAAAWQEWIYATGPIDIRRGDVFTNPPTLAEALDRGTGATNQRPNTITYMIERYYLYDYDNAIKASVLVDPCQSDCGTPGT